MKKSLLFLFLWFAVSSQAQELTGIWRGYFNQINYQREAPSTRYKFEVQIDQDRNIFDAVTYSYLSTVFYGKAEARGTINLKSRKVYLEELKIVEVRMSGFSGACIMTCFLQYSKSGNEEYLEGTYASINTSDSTNCGRGTVFLKKVAQSDFYKEPFLLKREKRAPPALKPGNSDEKPPLAKTTPAPAQGKPAPETTTRPAPPAHTDVDIAEAKRNRDSAQKVASREQVLMDKDEVGRYAKTPKQEPEALPPVLTNRVNEIVQTIRTSSRNIQVKVYDNGTIDNDTVSIYLDNILMLSEKRLTQKPLTVQFNLDEDDDTHELIMVAENLGEIPPNTSLMVINAGNRQFEVRISSTEQKNAVVLFKYDKDAKSP